MGRQRGAGGRAAIMLVTMLLLLPGLAGGPSGPETGARLQDSFAHPTSDSDVGTTAAPEIVVWNRADIGTVNGSYARSDRWNGTDLTWMQDPVLAQLPDGNPYYANELFLIQIQELGGGRGKFAYDWNGTRIGRINSSGGIVGTNRHGDMLMATIVPGDHFGIESYDEATGNWTRLWTQTSHERNGHHSGAIGETQFYAQNFTQFRSYDIMTGEITGELLLPSLTTLGIVHDTHSTSWGLEGYAKTVIAEDGRVLFPLQIGYDSPASPHYGVVFGVLVANVSATGALTEWDRWWFADEYEAEQEWEDDLVLGGMDHVITDGDRAVVVGHLGDEVAPGVSNWTRESFSWVFDLEAPVIDHSWAPIRVVQSPHDQHHATTHILPDGRLVHALLGPVIGEGVNGNWWCVPVQPCNNETTTNVNVAAMFGDQLLVIAENEDWASVVYLIDTTDGTVIAQTPPRLLPWGAIMLPDGRVWMGGDTVLVDASWLPVDAGPGNDTTGGAGGDPDGRAGTWARSVGAAAALAGSAALILVALAVVVLVWVLRATRADG